MCLGQRSLEQTNMTSGCWVELYSRIEDHFKRRVTKMSERDATEVPVQPQVIKLKELKFKCLHILSIPFNLHPNV